MFKILVLGDSGVGKTTFIDCHLDHECQSDSFVKSVTYMFGKCQVCFNVWDCPDENDYIAASAAIIMYDLTNQISMANAIVWVNRVRSLIPDIPIILCGNKDDLSDKFLDSNVFWRFPRIYTSAKTQTNLDLVFLYLAERLTGQALLESIQQPAGILPMITIPPIDKEKQETLVHLADGTIIKVTFEQMT